MNLELLNKSLAYYEEVVKDDKNGHITKQIKSLLTQKFTFKVIGESLNKIDKKYDAEFQNRTQSSGVELKLSTSNFGDKKKVGSTVITTKNNVVGHRTVTEDIAAPDVEILTNDLVDNKHREYLLLSPTQLVDTFMTLTGLKNWANNVLADFLEKKIAKNTGKDKTCEAVQKALRLKLYGAEDFPKDEEE